MTTVSAINAAALEIAHRELDKMKVKYRNDIIEECARVAENAKAGWTPKFIATAIRALKDKP